MLIYKPTPELILVPIQAGHAHCVSSRVEMQVRHKPDKLRECAKAAAESRLRFRQRGQTVGKSYDRIHAHLDQATVRQQTVGSMPCDMRMMRNSQGNALEEP